jgi:hypothetical protein
MDIKLFNPGLPQFATLMESMRKDPKVNALVYEEINLVGHAYKFVVYTQGIVKVIKDNEPFLAGYITATEMSGSYMLNGLIREVFSSINLDADIPDSLKNRLGNYGLQLSLSAKITKIDATHDTPSSPEVKAKLIELEKVLKILKPKVEEMQTTVEYFNNLQTMFDELKSTLSK